MQHGYTALMWAANRGKLDMAKLLIDRGAQTDIQDKVGSGEGHLWGL